MSHEHGPPSVDLGTVKWIVRGLWAIVLVFVLIDAVWFGPSWLASLGSHDSHQVHDEPEGTHETLHEEAHPSGSVTTTEGVAQSSHSEEHPAADTHSTDLHASAPDAVEHHSFGGHKHGHYAFEMVPAFHAVYGFAGCVGLVLAARVLRLLVMRDEDYYGDDAPFQEPEPGDDGGHHA